MLETKGSAQRFPEGFVPILFADCARGVKRLGRGVEENNMFVENGTGPSVLRVLFVSKTKE
jgi:hypothetical protein